MEMIGWVATVSDSKADAAAAAAVIELAIAWVQRLYFLIGFGAVTDVDDCALLTVTQCLNRQVDRTRQSGWIRVVLLSVSSMLD